MEDMDEIEIIAEYWVVEEIGGFRITWFETQMKKEFLVQWSHCGQERESAWEPAEII